MMKTITAQVQYKQKVVPVYWRNDSIFLRKLYYEKYIGGYLPLRSLDMAEIPEIVICA